MGWKNKAKKDELKNRDVSGLAALYQRFKKYGRGPVYWPLQQNDDSDEFSLDKYLEQHGRIVKSTGTKYLPGKRWRELYGSSFNFGSDLFWAEERRRLRYQNERNNTLK